MISKNRVEYKRKKDKKNKDLKVKKIQVITTKK